MAIRNQDHPFFRPLRRRVAVVAVTAAWCAVEAYNGEQTWALITGAICAYSVWTFLITYPRPQDPDRPDGSGPAA